MARLGDLPPPKRPRQGQPGQETDLERRVRLQLLELGLCFTPQARIGRYRVDFLVAGWLVIEADGRAWHPSAAQAGSSVQRAAKYAKDRRRAAFIASLGYTVLRLDEDAIRQGRARATIVATLAQSLNHAAHRPPS